MLKRIIVVMLAITAAIALTACNTDKSSTDNEVDETQKEKLDIQIEVSETLEFEQFNIEFDSVKAYEKDDKLLLDLKFNWRNKQLPEGSTLFTATLFDVIQSEESLEEINDSWNPEGDRSLQNDVFSPNTVGGLSPVKLTYELINKADNVEIIFTPTTETEDSQSVIIELQ